mgnify:CR=1 FL=1
MTGPAALPAIRTSGITRFRLLVRRRRDSLYRVLGLPPSFVRGRSVIEFGPGSGHNALFTASLAPARYVLVDGARADEDAVLMKAVFDLPDPLEEMSPVTLPRHYTTDFVMGRVVEDLAAKVVAAAERVARDRDVLLVEGTGHAGVGAVIGLSPDRCLSQDPGDGTGRCLRAPGVVGVQ